MHDLRDARILITGGAGFIGSHLAARLVDQGAQLTVVDSMIPDYGGNLFNLRGIRDRVRLNISDVRDQFSFQNLVRDQDVLFNLAGQTSHLDSMKDPFTDLEINCRAQLAILETCRHHNPNIKIVFASTRQLYGRPDYLPVDEEHPIRPVDVNGINKAAGEQYHLLYHQVYGIRSSILRLTNTYGPHMRIRDARQTFLGTWIRQILQGEPISVWGGDQIRDFNYVGDVVEALIRAASTPDSHGLAMNLGAKPAISLVDLARLLVSLKPGSKFNIQTFPEDRKKIDIGDYYSEYSLAESVLGWTPQVSLEDGLRQTLDFYDQHLGEYV